MKYFVLSKTFWFNVLSVLLIVATYFGFTPDQALADQVTGVLLVVAPVINLGLRFISDTKLAWKKPQQPDESAPQQPDESAPEPDANIETGN